MPVTSSQAASRFYNAFYRYSFLARSLYATAEGHTWTPNQHPISTQHRHATRSISRYASTVTSSTVKESIRPQNHYDLFPSSLPSGPPPSGSFHVNSSSLRKEFLQLQARTHPDRHQGVDKAKAEAASAQINEAYKTLLNPLARARYLLSLRGLQMGEDESIIGNDGSEKLDADLLMEVMEVREGIEAAESKEEIEEMKEENRRKQEESEARLDGLFHKEDLEGARRETVRLGYWVNAGQALHGWEKVGDGRVSEHE